MSLEIEKIIKELEEDKKEIDKNVQTITKLRERQFETVENLIKEYNEIFKWYWNNGVAFSHPRLKEFMSSMGPIVGYDEKEDRLLIYNYLDKKFEAVNTRNTEERQTKNLNILIRYGSFEDIVSGIKHTLVRQKEILENQYRLIDELEDQLNNF
ncbi:hypothetical protein Q433_10055 [Bacillus subtilis subsp. subtilis str. OH 131.1]|uniref:hypothetical protein n=1 Tax=Bacillus subtilis TaxID=1423 RepID=UPI00049AADE4|nr:hypothetical protein [Bacillus subtilis]AID00395.1 hypothetical protein Q433_10055 [Bacillus subtilis subsp. subtilis str. OH 131.1]